MGAGLRWRGAGSGNRTGCGSRRSRTRSRRLSLSLGLSLRRILLRPWSRNCDHLTGRRLGRLAMCVPEPATGNYSCEARNGKQPDSEERFKRHRLRWLFGRRRLNRLAGLVNCGGLGRGKECACGAGTEGDIGVCRRRSKISGWRNCRSGTHAQGGQFLSHLFAGLEAI